VTVDEDLLESLLTGAGATALLNPQAVGRVEGRLRRRGLDPRTVEEMAETLRAFGDLSASELHGPMEKYLLDLADQGRAGQITLPGTVEPDRWIAVEESALYDNAFPSVAESDGDALETVVRRYLRTHALIGLAELTRRYPIAPELATEILERWVDTGSVICLPDVDDDGSRWAERENLAEIHRLTVAIRRHESVAVIPEVFADFLVRRQHLHPATALDGQTGLELILEQLRGFAATATFWEGEILPQRIRDYRSASLDDLLDGGSWLWRASSNERADPLVTFVPREFSGGWPPDSTAGAPSQEEAKVLDLLDRRGASFAADLARLSGLEPSRLRQAIRELMHRGVVTNDRFDPLRTGGEGLLESLQEVSTLRTMKWRRIRPRRVNPGRPEGRWSLLESASVDHETRCLTWIEALFERYGILTRELLELDLWAPSWAELAPWLARAELRGEIRRGYFVEGFSGIQYATEEAAEQLAQLAGSPSLNAAEILVAAGDPANLYGSGAPLDIPLLAGGKARLGRTPGNYLVLRGGRPVLVIEAYGKRLTGLPSASPFEIDEAIARVLELARSRRQILKVETYNGEPALGSPAASRLAELGFVRDFPGMTYYAAWAPHESEAR
jgi:ATP-dependent Lhr-like helicase